VGHSSQSSVGLDSDDSDVRSDRSTCLCAGPDRAQTVARRAPSSTGFELISERSDLEAMLDADESCGVDGHSD